MKRTALVMVAFVFGLTGCASAKTDKETLTEPPILTVSTLNTVDSVSASCGNSHWNCAMPDGTTTTILACGAHPLDQQEHPILYTAFPVLYLDFGEILPETVYAVRWPASYIGDAQGHSADFEEVEVEFEENMITLIPLGDGDFIYEISAAWGEVGEAGYTFRTLPQMRGEQTDISAGIFDALNGLEYQPYTCDGLPEYRLIAADGTVYAINISDKWVWRGNNEQAELSDELIILLKENSN